MKKLFRKHSESILIALALLFLAIIILSFAWGISQVVGEVNRAENAKGGGKGNPGFDLPAARKLDLRGLVK